MKVHRSAYHHGLTDHEIHHAWNNHLGIYEIDTDHEPTKCLRIGPDLAGNLLELVYLQFSDDDMIIHAMPLRPVFRKYLTGENQ